MAFCIRMSDHRSKVYKDAGAPKIRKQMTAAVHVPPALLIALSVGMQHLSKCVIGLEALTW